MDKKKILSNFGNNVREKRTHLNLSQEELADLANVHRTYIGMVERGEKNISLINIYKLARALNIEMRDLF